jgi:hypothetical protein
MGRDTIAENPVTLKNSAIAPSIRVCRQENGLAWSEALSVIRLAICAVDFAIDVEVAIAKGKFLYAFYSEFAHLRQLEVNQ